MKALLTTLPLMFINFALLPPHGLLIWMGIVMMLDFLTGFLKAVMTGKARTSNALRRTVTKFLQYGGALAVGLILAHAAEQGKQEQIKALLGFFNDGLVCFIIYIEAVSIFENLVEMDKTSPMSKHFFRPVLRILTASIKAQGDAIRNLSNNSHEKATQ